MDKWLQTLLIAAQSMSLMEVAAVIFAMAYLLLAVRENVLCWLFAFLSTAIYTVLFWDVSLLMESALNVYYMAMAVYGWHQWTRGGINGDDQSHALGIRSMSGQQHALVIVAIAILCIVSGYLLSEHSSAAWPYVDSFTTWASVITTYLVARKYLQNWLYWIVIDTVSIPLYIDRGLNLTALLFVVYVVIAVIGYFKWREHLRLDAQIVVT
ncbi:MAG: nicotinamide mononucleotide transporter [Gammaproteobacteria bacterium]|nr:nicotinamide mononucleotide transporter [Gammaproteobacteria bacterium]